MNKGFISIWPSYMISLRGLKSFLLYYVDVFQKAEEGVSTYLCSHTMSVTQEEKVQGFFLIGRLLNGQIPELDILLRVMHDRYRTEKKTDESENNQTQTQTVIMSEYNDTLSLDIFAKH